MSLPVPIEQLTPIEAALRAGDVEKNEEKLKAGEALSPLTVIKFDEGYLVRNGCHRGMAHKRFGTKVILCSERSPMSDQELEKFERIFKRRVANGQMGFENIPVLWKYDEVDAINIRENAELSQD